MKVKTLKTKHLKRRSRGRSRLNPSKYLNTRVIFVDLEIMSKSSAHRRAEQNETPSRGARRNFPRIHGNLNTKNSIKTSRD